MWGVVRSSGEGGGGQVQGKVWGQVQREGAGGCSIGGPRARLSHGSRGILSHDSKKRAARIKLAKGRVKKFEN